VQERLFWLAQGSLYRNLMFKTVLRVRIGSQRIDAARRGGPCTVTVWPGFPLKGWIRTCSSPRRAGHGVLDCDQRGEGGSFGPAVAAGST